MKNKSNWTKTEIVEAWIIILMVIFAIGQMVYNSNWKWIHIPLVRIIFHAVSAIIITMLSNFLGMIWILITREMIGIWVNVIYLVKPVKILRVVRRKVNKILVALQPYLGAVLYVIYSYKWEVYQAQYYNREFQTVQFFVDMIFAIVGIVIWLRFFRNILPKTYILKPSESRYFVTKALEYIEIEFPTVSKILQMLFILVILLIPIWIILLILGFIKLLPWW